MQRELDVDPTRGRRVTLLDSTPRWRAMSLLAAVLVVIGAAVAITLWLTGRDGHSPEETARQFLEATTCGELRHLADDRGDGRLDRVGCQTLIDAARERRTYGDPLAVRHLQRSLSVGDASVDGNQAEVEVTVSYTEGGRTLQPERIGVVLVQQGGDWLVDDWGPLHRSG